MLKRAASYLRYFTAGDLVARVARGLRREIVGIVVYYHRPANYLVHCKSVGEKRRECRALHPEERRHISCVIGMIASVRIVVHSHVAEIITSVTAASSALVDVKAEYRLLAIAPVDGQTIYLCHH